MAGQERSRENKKLKLHPAPDVYMGRLLDYQVKVPNLIN
jgi:hypothetical protein